MIMKTAVFFSLLSLAVAAAEMKLSPSPCTVQPDRCDPATPTLDCELQKLAQGNPGAEYALQAGEHCVRHYSLVQNLVGVSFQGPAVIRCTAGNGLAFLNMTNLHFADLTLDGCGLELEHVNSFLSTVVANGSIDFFFTLSNTPDQYVAMVLGGCANFSMEDVVISKTEGLGLLGINLVGQVTLDAVTIEHNVPRGCFSSNNYDVTTEKVGGGAMFIYSDYIYPFNQSVVEFNINNSTFEGNSYCGFGPYSTIFFQLDQQFQPDAEILIGAGGGLSLILTQQYYQVNVTVSDSTFRNNTGIYGGGSHVEFFTGTSSRVLFDNCEFQFNGVEDAFVIDSHHVVVGSALLLLKDLVQPNFQTQQISRNYIPSKLMVSNSRFLNNTAFSSTVYVLSLYNLILTDYIQYDLVFDNCTFEHNRALSSAGIYLEEWKGNILQLGTNVLLNDVTFSHNSLFPLTDVESPTFAESIGIVIFKAMNVTISGSSLFSHNEATAITMSSSNIYVQGNVTFFNNSGSFGGGCSLSEGSALVVGKNSTLGFYNNTGVQAGGAFYVNGVNTPLGPPSSCFISFVSVTLDCMYPFGSNCPDITKLGVQITFEGNVSPLGNMIYGSTLDFCSWAIQFRKMYFPEDNSTGILELLYENQANVTSPFRFDSAPQGITAVTTVATRIEVHFPNASYDDSIFLTMSPGISLLLNVTSLDAFQQATPTVIVSRSLTKNITSVLGDDNFVLSNYNDSTTFTELKVYGPLNQSDVKVAILALASYSQITLRVNISDCPDGYFWNQSSKGCACKQNLMDNGFYCTQDGQLLVPYASWVGRDHAGVLMFGFCPLDYCRPVISIIPVYSSMTGSDAQTSVYDMECNSNYSRAGVACGRCQEGYSTLLGSNRCDKCSNRSLLLLVLFAGLGIILIAGMFLLQLTVSGGFLNGVLFFSNVLAIYAPYIPSTAVRNSLVLIFWLSFEITFESCFFNGMTALASSALSFVFPLYLYFLLLVIVMLSRFSSRFSRLMASRGCSPVKVFATILIMTYTSLLQTCISILAFTPLKEVETNEVSYRWTYDPSVRYFHHFHAPLAVFAILLLIFFLIPAPFVWMFPGKISARFSKYKPLYDAVWAPLKPKFRFWVSLRLILRLIPLVIVNFTPVPLNLLLLCIFLLILLFVHGVVQPFQGSAQNAMDSLFQVELLIIAVLSLYFTRFNLSLNSQVGDLDSAMRSNEVFMEPDAIQVVLIILALLFVYASLTIVFVWHLLQQFPKLRALSIRGWNCIVCRKFHLKSQKRDLPRVLSSSLNISSSYGSTPTTLNEVEENRRTVATFSVLREPLLESGLAEVTEVDS